jgi:hypothetical protein
MSRKKKSKGPFMQTVHITLSDGRKGIFTGPALVFEGEVDGLQIVGLEFSNTYIPTAAWRSVWDI